MDARKFQRVPPFTFFGTVTLFKNHNIKFFLGNFFKSLKGPPFNFFIFCHQQRVPPFTILSLRYSADFGRSRLVFQNAGNLFLETIEMLMKETEYTQKLYNHCRRDYQFEKCAFKNK